MQQQINGENYLVVNALPPKSVQLTIRPTIVYELPASMHDGVVNVLDLASRLKFLAGNSRNPGLNPQIKAYVDKFLSSSNSLSEDSFQLVKSLENGKNSCQSSLGWLVTERLVVWYKKNPNSYHYNENIAKKALNFLLLIRNHQWIDRLVGLYGIKNLPENTTIECVKNLIEEHDYMCAALFVNSLDYYEHFSIYDIAVPLMVQDKTNILELYLKGSHSTACQFLSYLDSCTKNPRPLFAIAANVPMPRSEKFQPKIITKLIKRLAKMFEIDITNCPNVGFTANLNTLRFLIRRKFHESNMDDPTFEENVCKLVDKDENIQEQFLHLLCDYNEVAEAKKWAQKFNLPPEKLPYSVKQPLPEKIVNNNDEMWDNVEMNANDDWNASCSWPEEPELPSFDLELAKETISFIDNEKQFEKVISDVCNYDVVGLDTEWKPTILNFTKEENKVALMQLATWDDIYLVDVIALRASPLWKRFFEQVMVNPNISVLGYSIKTDVRELIATFKEINFQSSNLVDVGTLYDFISNAIQLELENPLPNVKGLAKLVATLLRKQLKKEQQFSNWETRPLRPDQMNYAAMDVLAVLKIYEKLRSLCEEKKLDFQELLDAYKSGKKSFSQNYKLDSTDPHNLVQFNSDSIRKFKCVVDNMLQGLGTKLRLVGADTEIVKNEGSPLEAIRVAKKDNRIVLSSGKRYDSLKNEMDVGRCFKVTGENSYRQLVAVVKRFNLIVKSTDLMSRCTECNGNNFITTNSITVNEWRKKEKLLDNGTPIQYGLFPPGKLLDELFICSNCGHIYWQGCHFSKILDTTKEYLILQE